MGHYVKIFAVYDNGTEVFRGTAKEIEEKNYFIGSRDKIYTYVDKKRKLYDRWSFKDVGTRWSEKKDPPKPKRKQTKHQYDFEWIRTALLNHPFTSYHNDGREFVEELKAEGILFEAEKCPYKKGHYYLKRI